MATNPAVRRRLGQNFLTCRSIAEREAAFAAHRSAIEIGPGRGMLTKELCRAAGRVLAVEVDKALYEGLKATRTEENLELVNADFFSMGGKLLNGYDLVVSNIPYSLSSKTVSWLLENRMEAVLCVQREFAEHMLAPPGTRGYSQLSVSCALSFDIKEVCKVPASCFSPRPRVDSTVVHMLPRGRDASARELALVALLMEHKKRTLRNALEDARSGLGVSAQQARGIADMLQMRQSRVFKLSPEELLAAAREIDDLLAQKLA